MFKKNLNQCQVIKNCAIISFPNLNIMLRTILVFIGAWLLDNKNVIKAKAHPKVKCYFTEIGFRLYRYDCTKMCQRQICSCWNSFMSIQWASSSAPLEFSPKLNQPTISFFFVIPFRLYTDTIRVTSASWNSAT